MKISEDGYKDIKGFENRLILNTCLVVALASVVFTIFNVIVGFDIVFVILTFSAILIFSSLYVLGRYYKKILLVRWVVPIISTVFINLVWYSNYVSNGPALIYFILYYCFLILIGTKKQVIIFSVIIVINLIVLFLAEYFVFDTLPNYASEKERVLDIYIVVLLSLVIAFSFIYYAKSNYLEQYIKAKKADELKSSFLANMSHEIRTPLNAIIGFSTLLASREYDTEKRIKYSAYISSNSEYLLHLVNDILDISKIESNQLKLVLEELKVENLFEQLQEEYSKMLEKHNKSNVKIFYTQEDSQLRLKTDRFRFEQIIRNFLSNAVKFTKSGHIKFGSYMDRDKYIFYVEDTGVGISKEDLNLIFSRFTKLNQDEDVLHRGVGLGLFLSKQLISLMGGNIWAESEDGKGSTFYFSLPVVQDFKNIED